MLTPVVELHHATFGYPERAVVIDVDLTIDPGERVALIGPNGCGKSTLVKGLLGVASHLGGEARLFGVPLDEVRDRHRVGYVPQRHTLASTAAATVREVVATGRLARRGLFGRLGAADRRIVDEAIAVVGLTDDARSDVSRLSGGQQRRTLIARALASEPDVLVMDEPTAGVDAHHQAILADIMTRLADRGTTLLVVTHDVGPMRDALPRVVAMDGGRIVSGGHADLDAHHDGHHADEPPRGALQLDVLDASNRRSHG